MKAISAYLRKQTLLKLLSASQPRTATELLALLNGRLGTNFNRRTVVRDIAELSRAHAVVETPGHPAAYKLAKEERVAADTSEIFALLEELRNSADEKSRATLNKLAVLLRVALD